MKYGIITYHNIPNFGAILQAYALTCYVRGEGYECEIIDYTCDNIVKRELEFHPSNNLIKSILHWIFTWPCTKKKIAICQDFMKPFYSLDKYSKENILLCNQTYDAYISGSDMIWNLDVNGYDYNYFINFAQEKYHFSYGSSIGDKWNSKDTDKICKLLNRYTFLSVREADTSMYITTQFDLECTTVCDPTMLLTSDDWDKLTFPVTDKNYVLVYFPSERLVNAAREYCRIYNKKLIILQKQLPFKNRNSKMLYSPQEWISYIKNSDAVFTNSYHGLLFSVYFEKPVWSDNNGNRISSLLNILKIDSCYIDDDPGFNKVIDYDVVKKNLLKFRHESIEYLKQALADGLE